MTPASWSPGEGPASSVQKWEAAVQSPEAVGFFDGLFDRVGVQSPFLEPGGAGAAVHDQERIVRVAAGVLNQQVAAGDIDRHIRIGNLERARWPMEATRLKIRGSKRSIVVNPREIADGTAENSSQVARSWCQCIGSASASKGFTQTGSSFCGDDVVSWGENDISNINVKRLPHAAILPGCTAGDHR